MKRYLPLCAAAAALTFSLSVFGQDSTSGLRLLFDDIPVGPAPEDLISGGRALPAGDYRIVDGKSQPADPFGGAENRSLMIEKNAGPAPQVLFQSPVGFTEGRAAFRFWGDDSGAFESPPRAFMTLQGNGQVAVLLQVIGQKFFLIGAEDRAKAFDQAGEIGKPNDVVITFNLEAGTFQGTFNGEPLTIGDEREFPLKSVPAEINEVAFRFGTARGQLGRLFVDEISLTGNELVASSPAKSADQERWVEIDLTMPIDPADLPAGDQWPARVFLDLEKIVQEHGLTGPPDLSRLSVVGIDEKGEPVAGARFAYGNSPQDLPVRWDDASVPYEFPEVDHLNAETGELKREIHERLGAPYNVSGEGKAGWLAWVHTKPADSKPARYRVRFPVRNNPGPATAFPRAWIGDGVPRFTQSAPNTTGSGHTRLATTDWNGDGLPDLVLGENYGHILVMINQGTAEQPRFDEQKFVFDAEGNPIDVGISASPHVVDWDGDGKEDLLVGTHWNRLLFFRNIGTNADRKLEYQGMVMLGTKPLELPFEPVVGRPAGAFFRDYYPTVETLDWDNDGDLDLLAGGYVTGRMFLYENTGRKSDGQPILKDRGPIEANGKPLNVRDWAAAPTAVDLNGDGLPDLVSGWFAMTRESQKGPQTLRYFVNTGRPGAPVFTEKPFPFEGSFPRSSLHTPRAVDLNGDGLPDLAMAAGTNVYLFENIGTKTEPKFRPLGGALKPVWGNTPLPVAQFVDWNNDGLVDIITDDYTVLLNDGRGDPFFFREKISLLPPGQRIAHPSGIGDDWYFPRIYDFDGDGDPDVLFGDWYGQIWFHENRGDGDYDMEGRLLTLEKGDPIKVGPIGLDPKTSFRALQGARTVFTVADYNQDGKNDLVVGDTYGVIRLFLNVGTPKEPKFREAGVVDDLKQRLSVDTVDWNKDGYPDVIAGAANGNVKLFLNNGKKGAEKDLFDSGTTPPLPKIIQPRIVTADLNSDGDIDLFVPSTQGSVLVERSFLEHGYAEPDRVEVIRSGAAAGE